MLREAFVLLLLLLLAGCRATSAPAPLEVEYPERLSYRDIVKECERIKAEHPELENPEIRLYLKSGQKLFAFYKDGMAHTRTDRSITEAARIYPDHFLSDENLKGMKILDLGCGNGLLVRQWRELGYEAFGVDLFLEESHLDPPVLTRQDLRAVSFEDGTFDRVFCTYVLLKKGALQPEFLVEGVRESLRVMRPGGELYIAPTSVDEAELKRVLKALEGLAELRLEPVREGYYDQERLRILVITKRESAL